MAKINKNARTTLAIFGPIVAVLAILVLFQYNNYNENKKRLEDQLFRQQDLITAMGAERVLEFFKEISWNLDKVAFSVSHHQGVTSYEDIGNTFERLEGKADQLAYFDSSGRKKFSVTGKGALGGMPENARYEEFFLVPKNNQLPYISPLTKAGGAECVYVSWPMKDPGEKFAGVIVARLNRHVFSRLCQSLQKITEKSSSVNFVYYEHLGHRVCEPECCGAEGIEDEHLMGSAVASGIFPVKTRGSSGKEERFRVVHFPLQLHGYTWHLTSEMSLSGIDDLMQGDLVFLLASGGLLIVALFTGGLYFKSVYRAKARAESEAAYSAELSAKNDALVAEKKKLLAVLNSIPDGIMLIGNDGSVLDASPRMKEIAASARGDGGEGPDFPLETLAGPAEGVVEALIGGKTYKVISVPICGEGSGGIKEVRLVRDISIEKMLEQKKSEITHMITHDIKSPLAVIIGITQWLEHEKAGIDLSEEVKSGVNTISRASNRISSLLDNFLFLNTVEGPGKLEKTPVNLNNFLKKAVLEYELEAKRKKINLSCEILEHLPVVLMDETQMMRAVSNLISNALKYTPQGGEVSVFAKNFRDYITISVSDNGPGITKDDMPFIFNRYYRSKRTGKGKKGSGLGLAIVKVVVESHGGTVDVFSEEDMGATFTLRLPVSHSREETPAAI